MHKLLFIDNESGFHFNQFQFIKEMNCEFVVAESDEEAINAIMETQPDLIIANQNLSERGGSDLLQRTKEIDPHIPVIIFTTSATVESAVEAMKNGAYDYIQKPFPPERLESILAEAIQFRERSRQEGASVIQSADTDMLDNVIGQSLAMQNVIKRVLKVAPLDCNVLIYGESGTGKELIARNIHSHSQRKNNSFIPLDCNALPPSLLESEIFGFEKGAFTGAMKKKHGVVELAHEGTLFLDEITEIEPNLQAKLLRFLQEREFRRIGGSRMLNVDIRIISATNRNPDKAVKQGIFRQDLFYRLNVVPIYVPALRERKEDIPVLAHHFIEKLNSSFPTSIRGITDKALRALKNYQWPGNVRELQNVIEQAMSLGDSDIIRLEDLPEHISHSHYYSVESSVKTKHMNFKEAKSQFFKQFQVKYIQDLLNKCDGNISEAARKGGISRGTIYRFLEELESKIEY